MSGNLKETSESQGTKKVREFMTEFQNSQPMQVENPNFQLFWGACPKNLLNALGLMKELNFGLEKSRNFILSGK